MANITYEFDNICQKLEKYEWDNIWWEQTDITDTDRILYIGDSISCGTRKIATSLANGEFLFDGFGTSKALDNPYFLNSVSVFAKQQGNRKVVIFNNGLHGWHLDDVEEYPRLYEKMVKALMETFKETTVVLVLTTSVADDEREKRVLLRNEAVKRIAEKYRLPIIDLYSVSVEFVEYRVNDGVHFTIDGYQKFAERIVCDIKKIVYKG